MHMRQIEMLKNKEKKEDYHQMIRASIINDNPLFFYLQSAYSMLFNDSVMLMLSSLRLITRFTKNAKRKVNITDRQ